MKKNFYSILAFIFSILAFFISDIDTKNNRMFILISIIIIFLSGIGIVLSLINKKKINGKIVILNYGSIIIGSISFLIGIFALIGFLLTRNISYNNKTICKNTKLVVNCINNDNNISNCIYAESYSVECSTNVLNDSQFKK